VLNEIITNRSASNLVRATVQIRIKQAAIADVITQIKDALAGLEDVAGAPEPVVILEGVFEGMSRIRIDFWVPTAKKAAITAAVVEALQVRFPQANLKVVA
jgi:small-conductance mechanosensitive channel